MLSCTRTQALSLPQIYRVSCDTQPPVRLQGLAQFWMQQGSACMPTAEALSGLQNAGHAKQQASTCCTQGPLVTPIAQRASNTSGSSQLGIVLI